MHPHQNHNALPGYSPPIHHHYHYHYNIHIQLIGIVHLPLQIIPEHRQLLSQTNLADIPPGNMFLFNHLNVHPQGNNQNADNGQNNEDEMNYSLQFCHHHYYAHFHYYHTHGNEMIDLAALRTQPPHQHIAFLEDGFEFDDNYDQIHSHSYMHYRLENGNLIINTDEDDDDDDDDGDDDSDGDDDDDDGDDED